MGLHIPFILVMVLTANLNVPCVMTAPNTRDSTRSTFQPDKANLRPWNELRREGAQIRSPWPHTTGAPSSASVATTASFRSLKQYHTANDMTTTLLENITSSVDEAQSLIAVKAAITADPSGTLKSWHSNASSACGWTGVVCALEENQHHVIALDLRDRHLVGDLNLAMRALSHLPYMQRLDLSNNFFHGSILGAALANFSSLSYLNLSHNQIGGGVPTEIGKLLKLEMLDFSSNNITGEIPRSLANCTSLKVIDLATNLLQGHIPPLVGMLFRLEHLDLGTSIPQHYLATPVSPGNSFSGDIPSELGNCSFLAYLSLQLNLNLGGRIPDKFSSLKNLQELRLSLCSLQGYVPKWIGNLTSLTRLDLAHNYLSGEIPDTVRQLRHLQFIALESNHLLTGVIPTGITNCTKLVEIALNQCPLLGGHIPSELGQLTELEFLLIWMTSITGVLPPSIVNCSSLIQLEVGQNQFMYSQPIPIWIGSLTTLQALHLNEMNLRGEIPREIGRLFNLQSLDLSSNDLNGRIPSALSNCTGLEIYFAQMNQLHGELPTELGELKYLQVLGLYYNLLTGPIPSYLGNFSQLLYVQLDYNFFHGNIDPDGTLGRLSQLRALTMASNQLEGSIPETIGNCSNLFDLELDDCGLTGVLLPSLGNLTNLNTLHISNNHLGGTITSDLMRCTKLQEIILSWNNFEGGLSTDIGKLSFLQFLALDHNRLTKPVPESLGNCSVLYFEDLSFNQFTGTIPDSIFLSPLTYVNLSHNIFSGAWPRKLSTLETIQSIDVSNNSISGSILGTIRWKSLISLDVSLNNLTGLLPASLGSIENLTIFNASFNNFDGPVPDFRNTPLHRNLTNRSFLGNPALCGNILGPGRECVELPTSHNTTAGHACKGIECPKIWIPLASGGGGLLLVLVVTLCLWYAGKLGIHSKADTTNRALDFVSELNLSASDIQRITSGDGDNVIGVGAKSVVYKGSLPGNPDQIIAIKSSPRTSETQNGMDPEKRRHSNWKLPEEANILAQLRHRNILKVLGVYFTANTSAIVLEFMAEGSLHKHLHPDGDVACGLSWHRRLNIAVGVAEGMKYLHHDFHDPIVHGDLKPTNVLLDINFDAKVADFDLSKFVTPHRRDDLAATASTLRGTIGYMPPEYAFETRVSSKGDVYSFGILLLELLSATSPTSPDWFGRDTGYREYALRLFRQESSACEFLDSTLKEEGRLDPIKNKQMMLIFRIALFATRDVPQSRPSMHEVVLMLREIEVEGQDLAPLRSIEDLANEIGDSTWETEDPDAANFASLE